MSNISDELADAFAAVTDSEYITDLQLKKILANFQLTRPEIEEVSRGIEHKPDGTIHFEVYFEYLLPYLEKKEEAIKAVFEKFTSGRKITVSDLHRIALETNDVVSDQQLKDMLSVEDLDEPREDIDFETFKRIYREAMS